ncbi:MAG: LysM peptidoglycan-binding domain-containing protein [Nitrospiraceae bacterium]
MALLSVSLVAALLATTGCVFKETFEAEKARSLNFQRLLAQEEKRTAELDNELKRIKRDSTDYEARNRELSAQVQAAREQMGRLQDETDALREAMTLQQKAIDQSRPTAPTPPKKKSAAPPPAMSSRQSDRLLGQSSGLSAPIGGGTGDASLDAVPSSDLQMGSGGSASDVLPSAAALGAATAKADAAPMPDGRRAIRHQVKPGETVYRLSKRYGVSIEKIREWNNRKDDLLEVGEKLIVGFE